MVEPSKNLFPVLVKRVFRCPVEDGVQIQSLESFYKDCVEIISKSIDVLTW